MATPMEYGVSLTLAEAKLVMEAAEKHAEKQSWPMVIAIVDAAGHLLMQHRMDNAQLGSIEVSRLKAETALKFRRPTKALEDVIASGGVGLKMLAMPILPVEGGLPVTRDGKIVGAIGVSGMASSEDADVARAGIAALTA